MWESRRHEHIDVDAAESDEHPKYKFCCYKCEAAFQYEEETNSERLEWMHTSIGWEAFEANVKRTISWSKNKKHRNRGHVFREALEEHKNDPLSRGEKRTKVVETFHHLLAEAINQNVKRSNAAKFFANFSSSAYRIERAERRARMKEEDLVNLRSSLEAKGLLGPPDPNNQPDEAQYIHWLKLDEWHAQGYIEDEEDLQGVWADPDVPDERLPMHLVDTDNRPQDVSVCRECGPGWSIEDPQAAFMEVYPSPASHSEGQSLCSSNECTL